jgi:hypothetical protein
MQLIKDFSDIQKIVALLNSDNQNKLLTEINSLLVKYINEQNKAPAGNPLENYMNESNQAVQTEQIRPPVINIAAESKPISAFTDFQAGSVSSPPPTPAAGLNALKSSFAKSGNLPPPPPPQLSAPSNPISRNVAAGALNLKGGFSGKPQVNKKNTLTLFETLGYIIPQLTEVGKEMLGNPSTAHDSYQILKQINGDENLKQIYQFLYPNLLWGKFLEKVYPLFRERCVNFRKSRSFPDETEVQIRIGDLMLGMGIIDEAKLEKALQVQKEPPQSSVVNSILPAWMEKTKSMIQQEGPTIGPGVKKKLIGDTLVDLGMVTNDQLTNVLAIQRWLKNLVEHA